MSELDSDYYKAAYKGQETADDTDSLLIKAKAVIDYYTNNAASDLDSYPAALADRIRLAVCAQAEYIDANGGVAGMSETSGSVSLGKYSYSGGGTSVYVMPLAPMAKMYLQSTGLLYSGVYVRGL